MGNNASVQWAWMRKQREPRRPCQQSTCTHSYIDPQLQSRHDMKLSAEHLVRFGSTDLREGNVWIWCQEQRRGTAKVLGPVMSWVAGPESGSSHPRWGSLSQGSHALLLDGQKHARTAICATFWALHCQARWASAVGNQYPGMPPRIFEESTIFRVPPGTADTSVSIRLQPAAGMG